MKIYGFIYLVPDLQNTASCITICLLDKGNPMGLASITVFFYKPLALNWLCNSWHFLRQAQHLPMQAQCQHPSQFFNSQNHPKSTIDFIVTLGEKLGKHRGKSRLFRHHSFFFTSPWSKEHPAKLVQRDGQRDLCAQKSRCIGLEKQSENNDLLSSLLNEETRTDINDDRNDDNGFNDDNGDNNGCEERRVRMKSKRIKTFISGSTKHHKRDQQIITYSGSKEKYFIQKLFWGRILCTWGYGVASALPFLLSICEKEAQRQTSYIRILPTGSAREKRKPTYRLRIIMFMSYPLSD